MKRNPHLITLTCFFILISICLTITTTLLSGGDRVEARTRLVPNLQQPSTPTPHSNCSVPPYPAAAYGRNPYPTEIAPYFNRAGLNKLNTSGPVLPTLTPNQSPYVPCLLLQAMAYQESRWRHFEADYNNYGYTKISFACAYGLMQVASGMAGGGVFDQNRTNHEIGYNLGTGTLKLIEKWNALKLSSGGYPGGAYIVGTGIPQIVEDWYYAVWAYTGWGWANNPNNNCTNWAPGCGGWFAGRPPFDPSDSTQNALWYPYQELVWGYSAHPPTHNNVPLWSASNLSLPSRSDIGGNTDPNHYPNHNLPRPVPYHGSCSAFYLPLVLKNWQPALPCTGVTTYPAGQPYCTDKDGVVRACHAENANGSGDNEPTGGKVTDNIYYYDYSAPGVTAYYLDLPAVISGTGVIGVHFEVLALGYGRNYQRAHFDVKNPDTGTWSTLFTVDYHAGQAGPEGVSADGFFSRRISAVRIWTENLEMYYKPIRVDYVYMRCN